MVHIDRVSCALLGAGLFHAFLSQLPASNAAWGWTMAIPSSADFSCEEGATIGCPDPTHGTGEMGKAITDATKCEAGESTPCCLDSDFTCTVKPKAGKSCDVSTTMIKCSKQATPTDYSQPDKPIQCINMGVPGVFTVDSNLTWSTVPTCTDANAGSTSESSTGSETDGADTLSVGILVGATLLVINW